MVRLAYRGSGWSDPGERAAIESLLPLPPGTRVLDLGVGGGRTTSFLAEAGASYLGLDVTPAMVEDARKRFPDADLRVGDATRLGDLPDAAYDLIVFSLNGLDCLSHADRELFLSECTRLLAPGGALLFSTHNLDGPSYAERPSLRDARERFAKPGVAAKAEAVIGAVPRLALAMVNARRPRVLASGDGWAVQPLRAHEFRFEAHFARLSEVRASLSRAGLELKALWGSSGTSLDLTAHQHQDAYVHVVARRPPLAHIDLTTGADRTTVTPT
jgi:SAM-dependent methyltransferase